MPVTCARCSAVNPDGNLYCQTCGTPLPVGPAAVATAQIPGTPAGPPPGPPAGFAPPAYGAPGGTYQNPYYAPTGVQVPVHRTPWTMIVAAVVALVVIMAGGGTALALIVNRNPNPTASSGTGDLPSPSPAGTPSPVGSPTATTTAGTGTESNDGVTIPVPSGWTVQAKDTETIELYDPSNSGAITVASGVSSPPQTAQDIKNAIDTDFTNKFPDTKPCAGSSTHSGTFNGAPGLFWEICFTFTSGSDSAPTVLWTFAGANSSGSVYYLVIVSTAPDNLQNFLNEAKPITQGLKWKLS